MVFLLNYTIKGQNFESELFQELAKFTIIEIKKIRTTALYAI